MSYEDEIAKLEMSPRAELYKIEIGEGEIYYLTSFESNVDFQGDTYKATGVERSEHEHEREFDTDNIQVTIPITDFVVEYIVDGPTEDIIITIVEVFLDTSDFAERFKGKVINITVQGNGALLDVESASDSLRNNFPSQVYQAPCPYSLFDNRCGLNKEDFKESGAVTVLSEGFVLESTTLSGQDSGYFTNGFCEYQKQKRWITNHVGNQVTIQYPFRGLIDNQNVDFFPGDDKKRPTCLEKFNNVDRWGGYNKIPLKNIVVDGF